MRLVADLPADPVDRGAALERAHRTLLRGSQFVSVAARRGTPDGDLLGDRVAVRLLGNGLRELDRFLGLLTEEVALSLGLDAHEARAFARLHNTPNKLRTVRAMMDLASPDHRWLRAVGRLRICLHHCAGEVRRPGFPGEVVLAGAHVGTGPKRNRLVLTARAIDRISRAYRRMGDDLVAELARRAPRAT